MNFSGAGLQMDPIASQDPQYLAFMRGAGYSEAEVLADLARRQGSLTRQLDRAAPRFKDELRQAGENVGDDFEGRGLYRSGGRQVHQVDAENVVRRNEADFRAGIGDQREDLISNAMKGIAEQRRQAMDMALTSRQTAAINAANASGGQAGGVTGHAAQPYNPGGLGAFANPALAPGRGYQLPNNASPYQVFRRNTIGYGGQSRPGSGLGPHAL